MRELHVTRATFRAGTADERATGLLGYVQLVLNDELELDGVTLRRTAAGRLALSFPERKDGSGRRHPVVRPLTDSARIDLEVQVFELIAPPA